MSECCKNAEDWIEAIGKDDPETVPVAIHVPEETAHKAKWLYEYRKAQGDEVDVRDQLLSELILDTTFLVSGEPVSEWMD